MDEEGEDGEEDAVVGDPGGVGRGVVWHEEVEEEKDLWGRFGISGSDWGKGWRGKEVGLMAALQSIGGRTIASRCCARSCSMSLLQKAHVRSGCPE